MSRLNVLVAVVLSLSPLSLSEAAETTLSWTEPTTNTDGTPLTDLTSYDVYSGCSGPGVYDRPIEVLLAPATTYDVTGLPDTGTCYFALKAINSTGQASDYSNEAPKFFGSLELPGQVENLDITWEETSAVAIAVDAFTASTGTASTGNFTATLSTHTTGDLLVCVVFASRDIESESNVISEEVAGGWTAVAATVGVASSFNREGLYRTFYKKAASASETAPQFTIASSTATKTYFVGSYTISGFKDPAAIVQNTASENPTGDVDASIPSVTVNENQSLIIIGALMTNDSIGTDTQPTGFTVRYSADPNGTYSTHIGDDILDSFAGADWTDTWVTVSSTSEITFALSVEPAAAGATSKLVVLKRRRGM
jgi:hypothetical protein